jgi:TolB-like protein/class 3 adenylate cyclase
MSAERKVDLHLEIAHVLFMDVVGFSKLLINDQSEILEQLNQLVRETPHFREAEAAGKLIRLSTGDGMALLFSNSAEAPVECALEISKALKSYSQIQLRMGVHSGPINAVSDVNDRLNVTGAGINMAQRVMDCGDAGHILLSRHVAEDLEQYRQWQPCLHDLGECEVKHGVHVHVVNLYTQELGNPEMPEKFAVRRKEVRRVGLHSVWLVGGVSAATILLIGGILFVRSSSKSPKERSAGASASVTIPQRSIAVLPFENLSASQENAFFADGVQDEILTDLAKIADLKVISRTSVIQYRSDAARNLREIGKALGVAHLLEGSVQRANNHVRVNAQLVDARTDAHLWAQTYDRELADVFTIQSEIAKAIADQLQAKLSPSEKAAIEQRPTADLAAYDLYLLAVEIARNRASTIGSAGAEEAKRQVKLLDEAVTRDPAFVRALCVLATTHLYLYWLNADQTPARLDLARKALEAAARLQPDAGEVHLTRAIFYYWGAHDYAPTLAELALARRGLPNDTRVLFFTAAIERRQGDWEGSTRHFEQAMAGDPRNIVNVSELAASYYMLRRYDDAARTVDSALAWNPLHFGLRLIRASIDMAWKADLRRWKDLIASEATKTADPNDLITARLNLALMERDYRGAEQTLTTHGGAEFDDNGFFTPREWNRAIIARGLGDQSRANAAFVAARERAAVAVRERPEDGKALIVLAQIDATLGRKEDAIREGERAVELLPVAKDALIGNALLSRLAGIYGQAGEANRAFNLLEKVSKIPFGVTYGSLKLDEVWDPLHDDPRFDKIVEEAKKPVALK